MDKPVKCFKVYYKSRYYPLEGTHKCKAYGTGAADIRARWDDIIGTDEYKIVKIEELK